MSSINSSFNDGDKKSYCTVNHYVLLISLSAVFLLHITTAIDHTVYDEQIRCNLNVQWWINVDLKT